MQLHHLTLKGARHHPFTQAFEAVHLGLHQAAAVVAAPPFSDGSSHAATGIECLVARSRAHQVGAPRSSVLTRWNHCVRSSLCNRRMARLGVVGAATTDTGHRFVGWYLTQQFGQHRRVTHAVVRYFDGPNLQRVGINAQVHLAPLPPVLGPMFLALLFAFAQELDSGAVHQQVQRCGAGSIGQSHPQCLLAPAHGAEVRHLPGQLRQAQQTFDKVQALAQGQTKQEFDAQAKLDGSVGEDPLVTPATIGRGVPLQVFVQPNRQRPSCLQRCVVRSPVGGLVAASGSLGFTHARSLSGPRFAFVQQSLTLVEREG